MSGSPKYTNVVLAAQRRAQLEAARRQREAERRRREEAQRRRRIDAGVRAARARADGVAARLAELRVRSASLPQHADVGRAVAALDAVAAQLSAPADEAGLKVIGKRLREAERTADRLGIAVAEQLTAREHGVALGMVVAQLDAVADRARLDPDGHRTVTSLTAEASAATGDERRFPPAHQRLSTAAGEHLDRVRDRQATLLRLAGETDDVSARLAAVLADAHRAELPVPEQARLEADVAALRAESDGAHVSRWEYRLGELRRAIESVTSAVDARLDQLDRMAIIIEAASAALPAAGLQVVEGSLVQSADAVSFQARRADGVPIALTVHAADGRETRLEYQVDGGDVVVERTPGGEISRCDLTEELLERFHAQLGEQGVQTDGLHWAGKSERAPRPRFDARQRPAAGDRQAG